MRTALVTISDVEIEDAPVVSVFDEKLGRMLSGSTDVVALQLVPSAPAGVELLEWLAKWTKDFTSAGKRLVIAAATHGQFECLELSHPDQNLCYLSTPEELSELLARGEPEVQQDTVVEGTVRTESDLVSASDAGGVALPVFEPQAHATAREEPEPEPVEPGPVFTTGTVTEIAGEYLCLGCKSTRMWLKGDEMVACDNPECLDSNAGWQLSCDVF